jgi:TolB-like protein/Tfp pilus assembly protein PilF
MSSDVPTRRCLTAVAVYPPPSGRGILEAQQSLPPSLPRPPWLTCRRSFKVGSRASTRWSVNWGAGAWPRSSWPKTSSTSARSRSRYSCPNWPHSLGPDRFHREIEIAARLQHPHILTIHDSGETAGQLWFTMPYVEGESLRDRLRRERQLAVEDAVRITREAAQALQYAHEHGVVHRDIKPENILLTKDGSTLVADFGIARALGGGDEQLTQTGMAVGTPAYMSPEQSSGERQLDARTDIYSLGAVLYEMLTGETPYTGATAQAIIAKRFTEPVPSARRVRPSVPEAVDQAIQRALAMVPADRFATAAQFAQALTPSVTTPTATPTIVPPVAPQLPTPSPSPSPAHGMRRRFPVGLTTLGVGFVLGLGVLFAWRRAHRAGEGVGPKHLAVLPFENLGDSADAYFADGMTDELRGKLAAVPGLEVVAGRSSNEYRQTTKSLPEIAGDLGVEYVLVGKIRWEKGQGTSRVRVSPELIRVAPGAAPSTKWAQPFDAALTDVFQVQADIAGRVAQALNVALGPGVPQALAARPMTSPEAYDDYLRANEYFDHQNRADNAIAVDLYQRAIALDSGFALTWAKLARAHALAYWLRWDPSSKRLVLAQHAAERALALQPDLPEAHLAMGLYHYWGHRDYDRALAEFAITGRSQPNNADLAEAIGLVQRRQGKWQDALASLKRSAELDPLSYTNLSDLGQTYFLIRDYPQAERVLDRAIALAPDLPTAYGEKMLLYENWEGHLDKARAVMREALSHMEFGKFMAEAPWVAVMFAADSAYRAELAALSPAAFGDNIAGYYWVKARAYSWRGDAGQARAYYDSAAVAARAELRERPDAYLTHGTLGLAEAYLGHRAQAIQEGRRAVELLPPSKDALDATSAELQLAQIYTVVGEPDAAIEQLHAALAVPSDVSAAGLKADPTWAPLRSNPRFEQLVAGK